MNNIKLQQTCLRAINQYGHEAQLRQLQEECNELAVAVSHYLRKRKDSKENMIEELSDVYISMRQAFLMLECWDDINLMVDKKINRLNDRLNNSNN